MPPHTGLDVVLSQPAPYTQYRWALVTNDAARTADGRHSRHALLDAGLDIRHLYAPEHGLQAVGEDGAPQPDGIDTLTGLPVSSLYGTRWGPDPADLLPFDAVLFDIPDIGCRFYTYLWTLTHVMESCAAARRPLYIADRPNPIGTMLANAEGPFLNEAHCSSFLGRWNIPLKHACTLGELANYFAATRVPGLTLHVIPIPGYRRRPASLSDAFHPTSPAMPSLSTALLYPGLGLLEGILVNDGRGTEKPFTRFGAPWLQPATILEHWPKEDRQGVAFQEASFVASTGPYAGASCKALQARVTDPVRLMAVRLGISLLKTIAAIHPEHWEERTYPTVANPAGKGHLDRLIGIPNAVQRLSDIQAEQVTKAREWRSTIQPYLLYE